MNSVIEKYYPLMIRIFTLINLMSVLAVILIYTTNYASTKQGAVVLRNSIVHTSYAMVLLLMLIFLQKYAIYAISAYPLTLFILFTSFCTFDDTLLMNEWCMSFVGALFNM